MHLRFKQKTIVLFSLMVTIFMFRQYSTYVDFLVSRAWYEWVTFSSNSNVTVVNVVDMNKVERMAVENVSQHIYKAYLGKLRLKLTPNWVMLDLYRLAFDIHNLFERKQLSYFLAFGSAVGAIRHEGFIPWDDDLDIIIIDTDEKSIFNKISDNEWNENNIKIAKGYSSGVWDYKLFHANSDSGNFPSCDVFVITLDTFQNKYVFKNSNLNRNRPHQFNVTEVRNPTLSKFGDFHMRVLSPKSYEYLNNRKGKYWKHVGFTKHYDHSYDQHLIPMAFEIPNNLKQVKE